MVIVPLAQQLQSLTRKFVGNWLNSDMQKFTSVLKLVTASLALGTASVAVAGPLTIGEQVSVENTVGTVFTPSPVFGDSNGLSAGVTFLLNGTTSRSASAGMFVLDYSRNNGASWTQFLSFCLEPDVYLTPFSNPYTVSAVGSAGSPLYPAALISELWGRYRGAVVDDVSAAAFQVSLWELAYGATDRNLSTGAFRLTSNGAVSTMASGWLSSLTGTGPMASGLVVLVNNQRLTDRQDLITQNVPEPATLALLGMGLLGIGMLRRRKRS